MSEHETPETPQSNDPAPVGAAPDATPGTPPPVAAPGYPGTPPTNPVTPPAPDAAAYIPGGHQLPAGEPQPAPVAPGQGYGPGPVPAPGHGYAPGAVPAPAGAEFGPNKKLPTGAIIGIIAGGVVVLLVLAAAVIVPLLGGGGGGSSAGGDKDEAAPAAATPEEWVEAYLTAVSEGDAEEAVKYIDTSSYSAALLTDEVLEASLKLGPIDDIKVGEAEEGDYSDVTVTATFTIGGKEVSREFQMYQSSYDGDITMLDGAARVSTYGFDDVGLTVNGVEVPDDALVFPGTYEFGTSLEEFTVEGESILVVADEKSEEAVSMLRPALSDSGIATYRELVTTSLRECLAMKTLNTPCGMDVTGMEKDGYAVVDGTVTRVMNAEGEAALAGLVGEVSDRAVVSTYESFGIDISVEAQNAEGQRGTYTTYYSGLLTPKVDFAVETPKVVWE